MKRIAGFRKYDMWDDEGADKFIKYILQKDKHADIILYVRSSELQRAEVEDKVFCFKDYDFDFSRGKYWWKGAEIQLTKQDQVALFAWLTHADETFWKDSLRRMRERLGKDFLRENYFGSTVQD